jgi:hypothetical protein
MVHREGYFRRGSLRRSWRGGLCRSLGGSRGDTGCGEEHDSCNCTHFDQPARKRGPAAPC